MPWWLKISGSKFCDLLTAQHQAVIGDSFFATPSFGVGDKKPFVLQRRPAVEWTEWTDGISAA